MNEYYDLKSSSLVKSMNKQCSNIDTNTFNKRGYGSFEFFCLGVSETTFQSLSGLGQLLIKQN